MKAGTLAVAKEELIKLLGPEYPIQTAMLQKNWNRYTAVTQYLIDHVSELKHKRILDYGCGCPIVVKLLHLLGYQATGYEPYASTTDKEIAAKFGISDYYLTSVNNQVQYDVVLMVDVIEHISIIKPVMQDVYTKVATQGYLLVSTPNVLRIEMWLSFLLRKTGHPQNIKTFVNTDNNYTHHQREFTMSELTFTLKHFGFTIKHTATKDTQPNESTLDKYHELLGKKVVAQNRSLTMGAKKALSIIMKRIFPSKLTNNLLVIAQKQ
jgi:2-polyprenyl-3-methyl-5-hydroxy-6-metoxy-1,4-benzoquinol methylase